jgi:protein MpaA
VKRKSRWLLVGLACGVLTLAGCAEEKEVAFSVPPPPTGLRPLPAVIAAPPARPVRVQVEAAAPEGTSVQGRPLRCSVHGGGEETVLILGGIHGDEPAGVPLCRQLAAYLDRYPPALADRRVVIAPALNPDGLAANRRTNARGVDLNRNFAARNRIAVKRHGPRPLSEPEARYVVELIRRYRPARIVTIHQPLACVDWDGPARDLAAAVSRACGLPMKKLGARPGSLGSYAGVEQRIPIITLELPTGASTLSPTGVWRIYGRSLLVAIRFPSALAGGSK